MFQEKEMYFFESNSNTVNSQKVVIIPKLTTGNLKLAASTIPLEEFPTIQTQLLNKLEYNFFEENFINRYFLLLEQNFLNFSITC